MVLKTISWEFPLLAWAAGKLQFNFGTLRKHYTKHLTQVAARPSTRSLFDAYAQLLCKCCILDVDNQGSICWISWFSLWWSRLVNVFDAMKVWTEPKGCQNRHCWYSGSLTIRYHWWAWRHVPPLPRDSIISSVRNFQRTKTWSKMSDIFIWQYSAKPYSWLSWGCLHRTWRRSLWASPLLRPHY